MRTVEELLSALLPRVLNSGNAHVVNGGVPPAAFVYRVLTKLASLRQGNQRHVILVPHKLKIGFHEAFEAQGFELVRVGPTSPDRLELRRAVSKLLRGDAEHRCAPVRSNDRELEDIQRHLDAIGTAFSSSVQRIGWRIYRPLLLAQIAEALGILQCGPDITRNAVAAVSYEANGHVAAALFDAAQAASLPAFVANHNSHAATGQPLGDSVISALFEQRKSRQNVTDTMHWTPSDVKLSDASSKALRSHPCRLSYPPSTVKGPVLRLLHAANYQNWSDFFPWVTETSDEFAEGIRRLCAVVADVEGIELTVRVRPKLEVDADVVRAIVPSSSKISICSTETNFLAQLADHHVLISFFSTTVAQALQMGKPVLLWGSAQRYRQYKASYVPASQQRRSAVYAARDETELRAMIKGLRDHHLNRPLDVEETSPYAFPDDTPNLSQLTSELAGQWRAFK